MPTAQERTLYLLRALVLAKREQKMARKTRDLGLIQAADGRLARMWRDADQHITDLAELASPIANGPQFTMHPADKAEINRIFNEHAAGVHSSEPTGGKTHG